MLTVVTGSASGIGRAIVVAAIAAGHDVVGLDLRGPEGPDDFQTIELDVTDAEAVAAAFERIEGEIGPVTGLVNAAGILGRMLPPEDLSAAAWRRELDVDLTGTFLVAQAAGARMAARGCGAIVNIASVAGMSSAPTHAYSAAKAGVVSLTATLARTWGRRGVRVNAVSPGFTHTPALDKAFAARLLDRARLEDASALGRLVGAHEVAAAALWLLSNASSGVTGVNLPVDAGFLAGASWDAYAAPGS